MKQILTAPAHVNGNAPVVNGRGIPHRKLTKDERVRLAADLATGQQQLRPSLQQACALTGATPTRVRAELKARVLGRVVDVIAERLFAIENRPKCDTAYDIVTATIREWPDGHYQVVTTVRD